MMRFYRELIQAAGLHENSKEVAAALLGTAFITVVLVWGFTGVPALALCIGTLALAAGLEVLRVKAKSRQAALDALWPQVFDSFQNASLSGVAFIEQLHYLSQSGPARLRLTFAQLKRDIELGNELQACLAKFRLAIGSRHADLLALLIELSTELGGHGMSKTWGDAAAELRQDQALLGQVLAKQGWVSASAKVALAAPWLIALVLIQLPQNRVAFSSELGAVVLATGLGLSFVAFAMVNRLGKLNLPGRIFHGA
jgi:tight adherence protein B